MGEVTVFWFRRDLRIEDNIGLYNALKSGVNVLPIFIFDPQILRQFPDKKNFQINLLIQFVRNLDLQLRTLGTSLSIFHKSPLESFEELLQKHQIKSVYFNEDYEPEAIRRDDEIKRFLETKGVKTHSSTDQVIIKPGNLLKTNHTPYSIFTPFANRWKTILIQTPELLKSVPSEDMATNYLSQDNISTFDFDSLGYTIDNHINITPHISLEIIRNYHLTRDIPALQNGTSRLGVHLRFGTISIRKLVSIAVSLNEQFLNELIWREFFMHILYHFPHAERGSFKPRYDTIEWRNNEEEFLAWCNGETGIPIVDAGMRELNITGFMHNRVRMIVASYLTKHLLIDWHWGEAYFAQHLVDFELSANNGNWQWASGSGCDAAPYFRIFNPYRQQERFDPNFEYIKRWVPEYQSEAYQKLLKTDLNLAKIRCLAVYKKALTL
ncbi:MAG: deoxyribodipyrimidine photo-lyase [Bacteroidota bacterium]